VTGVFGVNRTAAVGLAALGLGTVGRLATADVTRVAEVFAGNTTLATEVINAAKNMMK
jgi:hypothetical protein